MSPHPPSDEVLHGHGHHHHDHMPISPSAPELREFEDSEFTYTEGDTSSTNSSSYSTSDDEDRPNVGQDEEEDFFHDAEDYSVASGSSSSSGLSMGDLIRELELEEDEEMFLQRRLAPELEELAAKELNEDPVKKAAMLREFRSWVRNNPSIKRCRLDSNFLLRFLRMKKYNFEAAKECLMKYFKFRQQHPFWAADLDVENPTLLELTSKGFVFVLPERDDQGRRVIFNIAQKLDPSRHTSSDMAKMFILAIETLLEDEENQIRGIVYVSDCRDLALQNIMIWTPADIQKILTRGEKAYPMRHKMIHFMNLPLCAWFAYELLRGCLSHKLRSRLMGHSDDVKLSSHVPKRILPKEYGGTIPVQEMAQTWIQELKTHRKKVLALDDMEYHVPEEPHHEKSGWGLRKYLNKAWMSAWHKAEKTVAHAAVDS